MATKKQIILPIIALLVGVGGAAGLSSMKQPPAQKEPDVVIPIVTIKPVEIAPLQLQVESQGVVAARYETRLVAQVSGEILALSEQFQRGGFVKKGQLLARIDPNDYEAALIEAESNLAQAQAALELELAQGRVAEEEWKNISDATPSDLGLRRPQLRQEQARVKAAEAAVKRARRNLERTSIVAPYDALIASREVGLGSYAMAGTELGRLMSTAVADVRLPVAANEMQYLPNDGIGAEVRLAGTIAGQTVYWTGKIVRSEGVIDAKSRMTYLVAHIDKPYEQSDGASALRFGTYVTASINGLELPEATSVSRHLVSNGKVPVLNGENRLHFQPVTIAREQARDAIISQGLNTGDRIILTALAYPVEGMELALPGQNDILTPDNSETQVAMGKE